MAGRDSIIYGEKKAFLSASSIVAEQYNALYTVLYKSLVHLTAYSAVHCTVNPAVKKRQSGLPNLSGTLLFLPPLC